MDLFYLPSPFFSPICFCYWVVVLLASQLTKKQQLVDLMSQLPPYILFHYPPLPLPSPHPLPGQSIWFHCVWLTRPNSFSSLPVRFDVSCTSGVATVPGSQPQSSDAFFFAGKGNPSLPPSPSLPFLSIPPTPLISHAFI